MKTLYVFLICAPIRILAPISAQNTAILADSAVGNQLLAKPYPKQLYGEEYLEVAKTYQSLAIMYHDKEDYKAAFYYLQKDLSIRSKQLLPDDESSAINFQILGACYLHFKQYSKSIEYSQKALEINQKIEKPSYSLISIVYNNIGLCYSQQGEYEKAFSYYQKALSNATQYLPENHAVVAVSFRVISDYYNDILSFDKAINYAQKALAIYYNHSDTLSIAHDISDCYLLMGYSYYLKKNYDEAIKNLEPALALRKNSPLTLYHIGLVYLAKSQYEQANTHLQKALILYQNSPQERSVLKTLSHLKKRCRDFSSADSLIRKALSHTNYLNFQHLKTVNDASVIVSMLLMKADIEKEWFLYNQDIAYLLRSNNTNKEALIISDYQKNAFSTEGSLMFMQNKTHYINERIIQTNLQYAQFSRNDSFKSDIFTHSEHNKAGLLRAQIKETNALKYAGISDSLLLKEANLRAMINEHEKQKQDGINEGKQETDKSILTLANKIFDLHQEHDSLKRYIEKNYPDYYRLKYDNSTIPLSKVQQTLLSKDQTLLSYFVGDSAIYAFVVRPDTFAIFEVKKDFPLENWVKLLRGGIYDYHTANTKTEKLYETTAEDFATAAFQLYNRLIAPLSNLLTKEVIVVPDGVLNYVPFDVLLTKQPKDALKFDRHSYFGNHHIISYNYSATLWQEMRNKRHKVEPSKNFIGFAPYYNGDTMLLSSLFSHDVTMRKGLDSLKYSGEEVFKAQKLMQGEAILNQNATKSNFEKMVGDYRIVHLATHGKANDEVGNYSFLAFTEQKDSLQNGLLYIRDIYNLRLNADLVVLSACETGIGELKRGEGVISLARAFAYAGAKSLVTTLWSVNDKSTLNIMEGFYRQLRKGAPKNQALWQAKLDYLAKSKSEMAHPFFWAAFISIGDIDPIKH